MANHSPIPQIHTVYANTTTLGVYEKLELTVHLTATFSNPYDYEQVHLKAVFIAPDYQEISVDGFYQEELILDENSGHLINTNHDGVFKIRFAPTQIGDWSYQLILKDIHGNTLSNSFSFNCHNTDNQGFIKVNSTNYLQHSNGDLYLPIGENMAWSSSNVYFDYKKWITSLSDNGGNFLRLWHAHWGLGIEWKNGWRDFEGLRRYHQKNAAYQDWLFEFCREKEVKVMLTLQHHGQISSIVNPEWNDNPYNITNGGMCQDVWNFFSSEQAKSDTKNRLRYIVARWGYSQQIMAWELFNEVDWMDEFADKVWMVTQWHQEMAAFLKSIDPYQHIVTTSFAHADNAPDIWDDANIDLTQTHFYLNNNHLERALVNGVRTYLDYFDKPTLTGEFGLGASADFAQTDPDGIHLHNALWATLFAGSAGTAMTWWWDNYIEPNDLYYHFQPLAQLSNKIPFLDKNMQPEAVAITGANGDLELSPTGDWGSTSDDFITIHSDGSTTPERVDLGVYLYGNQWNTNLRNPPTFEVNYPTGGTFSVQTSVLISNNPKLAIYVDGRLILSATAQSNAIYSVEIPAGIHSIKVDNIGRDWMTIAAYIFENLGSKIDAYVLRSEDKKVIAGWVLNNDYNHQFLQDNGLPNPVVGGQLEIENQTSEEYVIEWFDCLNSNFVSKENFNGVNENTKLVVPDLIWDMAFIIRPAEVNTRVTAYASTSASVYPNPAPSGSQLNIESDLAIQQATLFTAAGQKVTTLHSSLQLPQNTPAGFYWLKINTAQHLLTFPLVITSSN